MAPPTQGVFEADVTIYHVNGRTAPPGLTVWGDHPTEDAFEEHYEAAWSGELSRSDLVRHAPRLTPDSGNTFLNALWQSVEAGGPDCPLPRTVQEEGSIRSFRVGDIVEVDGTRYVCERVGWSEYDPGFRHERPDPDEAEA